MEVICSYALTWIRNRSYVLRITLSGEHGEQLAQVDLTSVFIDPDTLRPVATEPPVMMQ